MVEKKLYIAEDGTEFTTSDLCRKHEEKLAADRARRRDAKMRAQLTEKFKSLESVPLPYIKAIDYGACVLCNSREDYDAVCAYAEMRWRDLYGMDCDAPRIGRRYVPNRLPAMVTFAINQGGVSTDGGSSDFIDDYIRFAYEAKQVRKHMVTSFFNTHHGTAACEINRDNELVIAVSKNSECVKG